MPSNYNFGISQHLSVVRVAQYFVFCVVFYGPLFFLLPFSAFYDCILCPSSIDDIW
jgi:hypothetical protein